MNLLTQILDHPLDPGYQAAAAAREAAGAPPARGHRPLPAIAAGVLGLLLAASALALRAPAAAGPSARTQLVGDIVSERARGDALTHRIALLHASIERAQAPTLAPRGRTELVDTVQQLELVTGAAAATGPGVVLTLDDAASVEASQTPGVAASPRTGSTDGQGRVLGRDLQLVVNSLWQSGAEAVAVNNQRLTSTSAIRSAGEAILVDYRPLSPPYVVVAIGDPSTLGSSFGSGAAGDHLHALGADYGVRSQVSEVGEVTGPASLHLPPAAALTPRTARPGSSGPSAPGAPR